MTVIDTESVDTLSGTYRIDWHSDEYSERPYNEGLGFAYDGRPFDRVDVSDGKHSDEILSAIRANLSGWRRNGCPTYRISSLAFARYLSIKYGINGVRIVDSDYYTTEPTIERDSIAGIAWAPDDVPVDRASAYVDASIAEYRAWANGECYGYIVTDPAGDDLQSCWGYYGSPNDSDYPRSDILDSIRADAATRGKKSALVGAGFIGII